MHYHKITLPLTVLCISPVSSSEPSRFSSFLRAGDKGGVAVLCYKSTTLGAQNSNLLYQTFPSRKILTLNKGLRLHN
ncbi:hypothetical protein GQX74_013843 [Glossina fuscipes]|uniref:Uncharacterized protein n=1 Tax=Glossina palpalis gambiensis TaxID=67801 RepID=A0A1B0BMQ2_9MUSC|nr:hypothetical protein GQX74_013843 [Glossina fuscipes]